MTDQQGMNSTDSWPDEAELVVIGAGPGGYCAAFAAADAGLSVVIVDAGEEPGGVCLNRGCIPSKTLLHAARCITEAREAGGSGVAFGRPVIDVDKLREHKNTVVARNAGGIRQLAKARGIEIVRAWARFENAQTLSLTSADSASPVAGRLRFDKAILASGSRPALIATLDIDSPRVMDSTDALELPDVPGSLLVIGGGYIGLEIGTLYAALGSAVTVVEMTAGLLPGADRDLVRILQRRLSKTFKQIHLDTRVARMTDKGGTILASFEKENGQAPADQHFDRVLVAVGRTPNSDDIGLEHTQVKVNQRGFVETDERCRTAEAGIYAIGDVTGEPMLAHKASREAKVAVEAISGGSAVFDNRAIPGVVFTDPEIAWVGLTETEAARRGIDVEIAKFAWGASGRAAAMGRVDGLTKLIVSPEDKMILGVGIVGVSAGELIAEAALAVEARMTAHDLARTVHAHPTLAETLAEAAEVALGTAIHVYRPKR